MRAGFKPMPDTLYVVTAISNPARYRSRYELYRAFEKRMADAGAVLLTVEIAFGTRPFEVTTPNNPFNLQLRTKSEIWHKENALNLGFARLPEDWKYVAWVDADVALARTDWVQETIHQLQHYDFIQLFSHAQDLGPNHELLESFESFCSTYVKEGGVLPNASYYNQKLHPGYAWAATRSALDSVGGLIDKSILGAADHHMAKALVGQVENSVHSQMNSGFKAYLKTWETRAEKYIRRNIGCVEGTLFHYWHGPKAKRFYNERWKILVDNQFNPDLDLKRDTNGLYILTDRSRTLRDDIRAYFRARNEDSVSLT